jgi:hypothetical protein
MTEAAISKSSLQFCHFIFHFISIYINITNHELEAIKMGDKSITNDGEAEIDMTMFDPEDNGDITDDIR